MTAAQLTQQIAGKVLADMVGGLVLERYQHAMLRAFEMRGPFRLEPAIPERQYLFYGGVSTRPARIRFAEIPPPPAHNRRDIVSGLEISGSMDVQFISAGLRAAFGRSLTIQGHDLDRRQDRRWLRVRLSHWDMVDDVQYVTPLPEPFPTWVPVEELCYDESINPL